MIYVKIALCTETVWPIYGVEKRVVEMARRLPKYGYDVTVFTATPQSKLPELDLLQVSDSTIIAPPKRSYSNCLSFWKGLFSNLKGKEVDLIDANGHLSLFPCSLAGIAKKKPVVATIHDLYLTEFGSMIPGPTALLGGLLFEIFSAKLPYTKVLTLNEKIKSKMKTLGITAEVVPSGIDVKELEKTRSAIKKRNRIVYVGRLTRQKSIDILIRAFAPYDKESELVIVGEGEERKHLENLAKDMRLKNVSFAGRIESDKSLRKAIKSAGMLIMPSQRECFGIVPLEAMALGTCVISTATDGPSDYIKSGENGFLTKINDAADMKARIGILLNNTQLQRKFELAGKKTAAQYDWDIIVKRIAGIYDEVLEK